MSPIGAVGVIVFLLLMIVNFYYAAKIYRIARKWLKLTYFQWPYGMKSKMPAREWKMINKYKTYQVLYTVGGIAIIILLFVIAES